MDLKHEEKTMLTVKKSSFIFRLWLAVQRYLPGPSPTPELIEGRLQRMTLCKFFWDIPTGIAWIVFWHLLIGLLGLCFSPIVWGISVSVTLCAILLGFYPAGGCNRVKEELQHIRDDLHDHQMKEFLTSRWLDYFLGLLLIPPVVFIIPFDSTISYRRYRTLTLFGRSIYPYHLLIPAFLYWLWSVGSRAYQTKPDFAHSVNQVAWVLGIICAVIGLAYGALAISNSEAGKLTRAYFAAKKQNACPRITFTDD